ncbi:hypothetical protein ACP4OV_024785 [Aristida adscensionis]
MARPRSQSTGACACLSLLLLVLAPAATATSYSSLCRSPAHAPDLTADHKSIRAEPAVPSITTGHFSGGDGLRFAPDRPNFPRGFSFSPRRFVRTTDPAVVHVLATLTLAGTRSPGRRAHSVSFNLDGYYSTSDAAASAELCMVGSGSYANDDGSGVVILRDVALRLQLPHPSNLSRPFVTGRVEGPDFRAATLVSYADGDYAYGEAALCPAPPTPVRGARQVLDADQFSCPRLRMALRSSFSSYSLEYKPGAGGHTASAFPLRTRHRRMYLNQMHCARDGAVRAYMVFYANRSEAVHASNNTVGWRHGFLVGDEALVADGFWDSARRQLCLRACRVARSGPYRADLAVRECGIGVSLWFPAVWSIRDRSVTAGMIWNTSSNSDGGAPGEMSGVISVSRTGSYGMANLSDIRYNYTMVEDAKKHYRSKPELSKERKGTFPANFSYGDFSFYFYTKDHRWTGYASPVAIGSALVEGDRLMADDAFYRHAAEMKKQRLLNVSYDLQYEAQVRYVNASAVSPVTMSPPRRLSAEGVYDTKAGTLCMVACQVVNGSSDCETLVTARFAPVDDEARERVVGRIRSLREQGDPLFFEALDFVAYGMYAMEIQDSSSRMDMEGMMLVVSMTLSCVFIVLQLRHARRNPEALAAMSITMLVILAVGYMIPLVLNLEAMFANSAKHFVQLTRGGWLELNELALRASTMVAFVLQLRLLQLAFSARSTGAARKDGGDDPSAAERSALWVCLPLYILGAIVIWIFHKSDGGHGRFDPEQDGLVLRATPTWPAGLVDRLASYAGLILDGFLLPQVVANAFSGSTVRALSPWFYAGGAAVRAAPHAYDVFRAQSYVPSWMPSYVYAGPRDDLFGVAWDVAVLCGAATLAALLFLQQRLGGAFLCGMKARRAAGYEMVSTLGS